MKSHGHTAYKHVTLNVSIYAVIIQAHFLSFLHARIHTHTHTHACTQHIYFPFSLIKCASGLNQLTHSIAYEARHVR